MIEIDRYLVWRFDLETSNCWHMARAAWLELTGRDLGDLTPEIITADALRGRMNSEARRFRELPGPREPSLVLMRHGRAVPHVGVYHRGRVLQVTRRGASYMPLPAARAGFSEIRFYDDQDRHCL
jgi:hypothetical protein